VHESISPARKRPAPVVLAPELGTEWLFDVGDGLTAWPWKDALEVTRLVRARTPKAKARSGHLPVHAYSTTTKTHLHLESGLEHDLLRELDRQPDVTWLVAQPCRLRLPAKRRGRRLEHVPDLLSVHHGGRVRLWDVRPAARQDDDFQLKVQADRSGLRGGGVGSRGLLGHVPRFAASTSCGSTGSAARCLGTQVRCRMLDQELEGESTIGAVLAADAGGGHLISAMWHGIWDGRIACDLDRPLTRATAIRVDAASGTPS
jgi:hypothetical protein